MNNYIVGLNLPIRAKCHESGVALVDDDGEIRFAVNEERLSRRKLDGGLPQRSVEAMFAHSRIRPEQVRIVAIPSLSVQRQALRYAAFLVQERLRRAARPDAWPALARMLTYATSRGSHTVQEKSGSYTVTPWRDFVRCHFPAARIIRVDHHLAHASGAYFTSPWDSAIIVTLDGAGNLSTSIVADGTDGRIRVVARTLLPHSLGSLWGSVTRLCGFQSGTRHGGKVTGLAAYGNPDALIDRFRGLIWCEGLKLRARPDLLIDDTQLIPYWDAYKPESLKAYLGESSREDVAAAAQLRLEEVVLDLIGTATRRIPRRRVVAAGGVFANVLMNQRLREHPAVDDLYIFPAMSDGGLALGAALYALSKQRAAKSQRLLPSALKSVYLGPEYSEAEIEAALQRHGLHYSRETHLAERVADLLLAGKIVGLFQGRLEYGPRALGNRSILCAPTDRTINDSLNARLQRSEFMPFAPVTLREHAARCYRGLGDDAIAARYMTITYDCTEEMMRQAPACVHLDGTARPQIIDRETNALYYDILAAYYARSGIPSLVNTSFNMHEEPIVCSPDDAIRAFLAAPLDYLAIGGFLCTHAKELASGSAPGRKAAELPEILPRPF